MEDKLPEQKPWEIEGLSEEDYNELKSLVEEPWDKDIMTYEEMNASLGRWFGK